VSGIIWVMMVNSWLCQSPAVKFSCGRSDRQHSGTSLLIYLFIWRPHWSLF